MNPRSDIHDRLAASLREARRTRGLSLDAVAKLSGVSRSMVSQIERGESSPTVATLWNLTQALQVDFAGLMEGRARPGIEVTRAAAAPVIDRWAGLRPRAASRAPMLGAWPGLIDRAARNLPPITTPKMAGPSQRWSRPFSFALRRHRTHPCPTTPRAFA